MNTTGPSLEIRVARQNDEEAIVELYRFVKDAYGGLAESVQPPTYEHDQPYAREPIERYVAIRYGHIVGHGLIQDPNPDFLPVWGNGIDPVTKPRLIEIGGLLVDPLFNRTGIWTALFKHRLAAVRELEAVPVSSTLSKKEHIKQAFKASGGVEVGEEDSAAGLSSLYVFA